MHPKALWNFLKTQPPSFWLINSYLFFEYVRPQSIYPALEGPWAQVTILLSLGAFLLEGNTFRLKTPADILLCVFSLILLLSSIGAYRPGISYSKLSEYFTWVLIYLLISNIVTTERRFLILLLAFLLYNFKMSQHAMRSWAGAGFAFRDWGVTGGPGWFHNSGEFGIEMTIFIPLVAYFTWSLKENWGKKTTLLFYAMLLTAVVGTIGSSSRGAMLGAGVVAIFMLAKTPHKFKGGAILLCLALFAFFMLPEESLDRFRDMGSDGTSTSRIEYWKAGLEAMREHPMLGIGYANWPAYMYHFRGDAGLPHNIFIQAGAELGYTGLLAFVGLIVATFSVNHRTRKLVSPLGERGRFIRAMGHGLDAALVGFLVSGSFVTVLYYPYFWINLAMTVALHNAARNEAANQLPSRPVPRAAARSNPRGPALIFPRGR